MKTKEMYKNFFKYLTRQQIKKKLLERKNFNKPEKYISLAYFDI